MVQDKKRKIFMKRIPVILASGSKARSKILSQCGIPHLVKVSNAEEIMEPHKGPAYNARINARRKAEAVSKTLRNGIVIGADTIVLRGKCLIGKPSTKAEARQLLKSFSGKTISLYTGLYVRDVRRNRCVQSVTVSIIKVKRIDKKEIDGYLEKLGPYDKAGGFSIEGVGSFIFDDIKGSYFNIIGLPMTSLNLLFKRLGVPLLDLVRLNK